MLVTAAVVSKAGWLEPSSGRHWMKATCRVLEGQYANKIVDVYYSQIYKREILPNFEIGISIKIDLILDDVGHIRKAQVRRQLRDRRI